MYPFSQNKISSRLLLREFSRETPQDHLVWHRDKQDRVVRVVSGSGWKIQFDNNLPVDLLEGKSYRIQKNVFHRVIKGDSDLVVEVILLD